MTHKLSLQLISLPALIGVLLMLGTLTEQASATKAKPTAPTSSPASCDLPLDRSFKSSLLHQDQSIMLASAGSGAGDETATLDFSAAESDAAVALFGCDCPSCINALRQLQNQLLNSGNGHCWTALQRRVSPQQMQEVLQNLEAQEMEPAR